MIPDTYNIKKEYFVYACKACDWLCNSFRLALLEGSHDRAVALYSTGNVNLHTPFANVKGELFYPVHCAVLGGNLDVLKWLVDENCCPIKSFRVAGNAKDSARYTAIVTSKGRSLLGIAMENEDLQIVRYLVVEKGIALSGEQDVTPHLLCRNLEKVLRLLPSDCSIGGFGTTDESPPRTDSTEVEPSAPDMAVDFYGVRPLTPPPSRNAFDAAQGRSLSEEARDFGAVKVHNFRQRNDEAEHDECSVSKELSEECKLLFFSYGSYDPLSQPSISHHLFIQQVSSALTGRLVRLYNHAQAPSISYVSLSNTHVLALHTQIASQHHADIKLHAFSAVLISRRAALCAPLTALS